MSDLRLSRYFTGIAVKTLSAVEADPSRSNQHEFNAVTALKPLMGDEDRLHIPTRFMRIRGVDDVLSTEGSLTWYDARRAHPTRSEYRVYFRSNPVMDDAVVGDRVWFALRPDSSMMVILTPVDSSLEGQLAWLFDLQGELDLKLSVRPVQDDRAGTGSGFVERLILGELGIEIETGAEDHAAAMLARFGDQFPSTREFSAFARETAPPHDPVNDPDGTLMTWMAHEEDLFRQLERKIVEDRLRQGFTHDQSVDVDGFISFSLSVQNRRKSRVGYAFEHHLAAVIDAHGLAFERGAMTENRAKPDFLLPSAESYHDPGYPSNRLTMLGAKSTCKDRWRQVLSEAERIPQKHLVTLEPGISSNQLHEMAATGLQLVVPSELHATWPEEDRARLMSLSEFILMAMERQIGPTGH